MYGDRSRAGSSSVNFEATRGECLKGLRRQREHFHSGLKSQVNNESRWKHQNIKINSCVGLLTWDASKESIDNLIAHPLQAMLKLSKYPYAKYSDMDDSFFCVIFSLSLCSRSLRKSRPLLFQISVSWELYATAQDGNESLSCGGMESGLKCRVISRYYSFIFLRFVRVMS